MSTKLVYRCDVCDKTHDTDDSLLQVAVHVATPNYVRMELHGCRSLCAERLLATLSDRITSAESAAAKERGIRHEVGL